MGVTKVTAASIIYFISDKRSNRMQRNVTYVIVLFALFVAFTSFSTKATSNEDDNDSCYSFAGGSVYPAHEPKGDHQLQYTKAVSKYLLINSSLNLKPKEWRR